jgi:DNA-binding SARP family transcriptional activator
MLRIYLFGNLHIFTGDTPLPRPAPNKIFVLLTYLLLKGRCSVFCEHLPYRLWPDASEIEARANLRQLGCALFNVGAFQTS